MPSITPGILNCRRTSLTIWEAARYLVDKGELRVGDPIVAGAAWGKVRAMLDDKGRQLKVAPPAMPVEVLGIGGVPMALVSYWYEMSGIRVVTPAEMVAALPSP